MQIGQALAQSATCLICVVLPACTILPGGTVPEEPEPLAIAPTSLPNGVEGTAYRQELTTDGTASQSWQIASGSLPSGLALTTSGGVITGVPIAPGSYAFTVSVQDSSSPRRTGQQAYSLTIYPRLQLDATLAIARVGIAYSATPTVTGGAQPYNFDVVGLPAGMTFDASTGTISGTPVNSYAGLTLEISVSDSGAPTQTVTERTTLVIKPPPVSITTAALAAGQVNESYSERLLAAQGQAPYTWAVISGMLPDGLRLTTSTGVISGTPTTAQTSTVVIQVTDGDSPASTDSQEFTITIDP